MHNVLIHPSGDCTEDGATLVGETSPATYTVTDADVASGSITFACDVGSHCESGMILTFQVDSGRGDDTGRDETDQSLPFCAGDCHTTQPGAMTCYDCLAGQFCPTDCICGQDCCGMVTEGGHPQIDGCPDSEDMTAPCFHWAHGCSAQGPDCANFDCDSAVGSEAEYAFCCTDSTSDPAVPGGDGSEGHVLCPGLPAQDFCDCGGDCTFQPAFCACAEAQAPECCGGGGGGGAVFPVGDTAACEECVAACYPCSGLTYECSQTPGCPAEHGCDSSDFASWQFFQDPDSVEESQREQMAAGATACREACEASPECGGDACGACHMTCEGDYDMFHPCDMCHMGCPEDGSDPACHEACDAGADCFDLCGACHESCPGDESGESCRQACDAGPECGGDECEACYSVCADDDEGCRGACDALPSCAGYVACDTCMAACVDEQDETDQACQDTCMLGPDCADAMPPGMLAEQCHRMCDITTMSCFSGMGTCDGCHAGCEISLGMMGVDPSGPMGMECHEGCESDPAVCVGGWPARDQIQEYCPQHLSDCELDETCMGEFYDMFELMLEAGPDAFMSARPQSELFNELAVCVIGKGEDVCASEIRGCWHDDSCHSDMESPSVPTPGNPLMDAVMGCRFARDPCDPYACWLDEGCSYVEFALGEELKWCSDQCWVAYENSGQTEHAANAANACEVACHHEYEGVVHEWLDEGLSPESLALFELLRECRQHTEESPVAQPVNSEEDTAFFDEIMTGGQGPGSADAMMGLLFVVAIDIGFRCPFVPDACANMPDVCVDCDVAGAGDGCVGDDGTPAAGCNVRESFVDAVFSEENGHERYLNARCEFQGWNSTEAECVAGETNEAGEQEPGPCEWSGGSCTPTAAAVAGMGAAFSAVQPDCSDGCTCTEEDTRLVTEGLLFNSTVTAGCLACLMDAGEDEGRVRECLGPVDDGPPEW